MHQKTNKQIVNEKEDKRSNKTLHPREDIDIFYVTRKKLEEELQTSRTSWMEQYKDSKNI